MKKLFILAAAALMFTACSKDSEVVPSQEKNDNTAIGFQVLNKNMSRAKLQDEGHLNFGVFAYKSTDATNNIMDDYLVGYMDEANKKGYKFASTQTTLSSSYWAYEKLGTSEYTLNSHIPGENYYLADNKRYMSNNANQYLRYWDKSAPTTNFYAYAPYVNKEFNHFATGVTYNNGSHTMIFPAASIVAGFDERDKYEFLFAGKQVASGLYGNEVELAFKHMNARVRITFYEEIEGYQVTMKPLKEGTTYDYNFISAVPSLDAGHAYGDVFKTAGANIVFSEPTYETGTVTINNTVKYDQYLPFNVPRASFIAENKTDAVNKEENYSSSVYYAIPKNNTTGLTFHVSFLLTSTTGETILVKDATVYVPSVNCNWEANKSYTYVFKITKKATGDTKPGTSIDPNDPNPKTEGALFPIIFDNCTVEDWEAATESDHNIN